MNNQNPEIVKMCEALLPGSREAKATKVCVTCHAPFSAANTHSEAGWRKTRISGMCEDCWDSLFAEPADD